MAKCSFRIRCLMQGLGYIQYNDHGAMLPKLHLLKTYMISMSHIYSPIMDTVMYILKSCLFSFKLNEDMIQVYTKSCLIAAGTFHDLSLCMHICTFKILQIKLLYLNRRFKEVNFLEIMVHFFPLSQRLVNPMIIMLPSWILNKFCQHKL